MGTLARASGPKKYSEVQYFGRAGCELGFGLGQRAERTTPQKSHAMQLPPMHGEASQDYNSTPAPASGEVEYLDTARYSTSASTYDIPAAPDTYLGVYQPGTSINTGNGAYYAGQPLVQSQWAEVPRVPSQATATGADHSYRRHTQSQPLTTRERAVSSSYHTTVMSAVPAYGGNDTPMSNYQMPQQPPREHSVSPGGYNTRTAEELSLPMGITEQLGDVHYMGANSQPTGSPLDVNISTICHKNFFMGDKFFTCYRRNYMSCNVAYSLAPYYSGAPLYFTPISTPDMPAPIHGFAMCISAIVAEHHHQEVVLLQHTPKRDKGPIKPPVKTRLAPKSSRHLVTPPHIGTSFHDQVGRPGFPDIYSDIEGPLPTEHNFERIQFKMATANNGERRAGQQRYQLVTELWGDVSGEAKNPHWVKIAIQRSADIVVRGRSPGHYHKERSRRSDSSGGGGGPGPSSQGHLGHPTQHPGGQYAGGNDYGTAAMLGGHHQPSSYGAPGGYDHRGGGDLYGGGGGGGGGRRDMAAYSIDHGSRVFPSAFTSQSAYSDPALYGQHQSVGVSPLDVYGKPRGGEPDMGGVLPRPEPQIRMGIDTRCNASTTTGVPSSILPPLMSNPMVNAGGFMSSS